MNTKQAKPFIYFAAAVCVGAIIAFASMKAVSSSGAGDSKNQAAENAATPKTKKTPAAGGSSETGSPTRTLRELAGRADTEDTAEDAAEDEKAAEEMRVTMRERQMDRFTKQAAKWSAALGLGPEQNEKLMEAARGQLDELEKIAVEGMDSEDPAAVSASARRAMEILSGSALESSLSETLTLDQRKSFEEFGARQDVSRAESSALRQVASLNEELMLTPEQRNQVYAKFYDGAINRSKDDEGLNKTIENIASSAGVSVDPSMQGVLSKIASRGLAEFASGRELDPEALEAMARETVEQSAASQAESLRGILTDSQLEIYRNQMIERMQNFVPTEPEE